MNSNKFAILVCSLVIGVFIALSPVIVTGHWYDITHVIGNLLVAEFIVRTIAIVIGLLVIFSGIKRFFLSRALPSDVPNANKDKFDI
ncbi:hypothetical protein I8J29_33265 [Paenibacillus sp. MWE-103]|uniref:Uncharacterized protein n=1 Tax=Paenibacillus artemisiicola TaxID=1172618 RepID=A0ABS3WL71_9BACL|nr:hypothetical protein [Paenibacillus artemisiicola]MBO7749042.1 hypothetical protein [Paenibacillus artemisiicola]